MLTAAIDIVYLWNSKLSILSLSIRRAIISILSVTNIRVPEEEELMTIND